jgi:glycosyltransferase involved in cell wall biosynthesis
MRVLHVHSGNLYGGVETFLVTLARCRSLCPSMEMGVALCFEGRLSRELEAEGVAVHMLGAVRLRRPTSMWRARRVLAGVLETTPYDVVICHQAWAHAIFGRVARSAGVPLVFWEHTGGDGRHWLHRWARRTRPDLVVFNSRFTWSVLGSRFGDAPATWVYCPVLGQARAGVLPGDRDRTRHELQTSPGDTVVIQVSRLEPRKGQDVCLEALARLRDVPGWTCWQVGGVQRPEERRYLDTLRARADRLGIGERVRFLGERADVPSLLGAADLYCQPNTSPEAFGITFVEALSAGLPVVATAIGGALEIVDETCGLLVPPLDAEALAAALRPLIEDDGLRARLAHRARLRSRELSDPATQIRRIHDLLRPVARSSAPAGPPAQGC